MKKFTRQNEVILLGAGASQTGYLPPALLPANKSFKVLDWLLAASYTFSENVTFIGGYNINEIKKQYPKLSIKINERWKDTSPTHSFFIAAEGSEKTALVSYTDIIYREIAVKELLQGLDKFDMIMAVDSLWRNRFKGRETADIEKAECVKFSRNLITSMGLGDTEEFEISAEFAGFFALNSAVRKFTNDLPLPIKEKFSKRPLIYFLEFLRIQGFKVSYHDVKGDWAELNDPMDLAEFVFGTKAETLSRLKGVIKRSNILEQVSFTVEDWKKRRDKVLSEIISLFPKTQIIVRSSTKNEDTFESANAGFYESVSNVASEIPNIIKAVNKVIRSFGRGSLENQILIQKMVQNVASSGVLFSRTIDAGAPYYVFEIDSSSGKTDTVTGGNATNSQTIKILRSHLYALDVPLHLRELILAAEELEQLLGIDCLDIEFAVSKTGKIYIFQVRPLAKKNYGNRFDDYSIEKAVNKAREKFRSLQQPSPLIKGNKTIFGSMPDWNPAEIIGRRPRRLAIDLYKFLVTDKTWAIQRAQYGYRKLQPEKLMDEFLGQPYIDVRASLNSFVPFVISDNLALKILNYCLHRLEKNPEYHDKIEFEVIPTCFSLDFEVWRKRFLDVGFSKKEVEEIETALFDLTRKAITRRNNYSEKLSQLSKKRKLVLRSNTSLKRKIEILLFDTRELGVLPFAHLARDAFVSISLLKGAVAHNIISEDAYNSFLNGLNTITEKFTRDAEKASTGNLVWEAFVEKYGHLRPDTYNILSECYKQNPEKYLRSLLRPQSIKNKKQNSAWDFEKHKFFDRMVELKLASNAEQIEKFLQESIQGREYAKFVFTRSLSEIIELIADYGAEYGFSREELSNINLHAILSDYSEIEILEEAIQKNCEKNKKISDLSSLIELPPLIINESNFNCFTLLLEEGNFIGDKNIVGDIIFYETAEKKDFSNKIIFIENADPGYDWMFGLGISGLVTKFGGSNSHMAIRCAEFGLPALIGAGEVCFTSYETGDRVLIDCKNKFIKKVG
ncbi:PEP-utilizing enzyme [Alphaproteobacteria bacterium]|nr:PEP-utilizing enzyme [Alphaproteobacteria bacterium]